MARWSCLALVGILFAVTSLHAQKVPARPPLAVGADTNDPADYYREGLRLMQRQPAKAIAAFYWAARLNPLDADALYGHRMALIMEEPRRMVRYWMGDRAVAQSREIRQADSLYLRALELQPLIYPRLDALLFRSILDQIAKDAAGTHGERGAIAYDIEVYLSSAPPALRAWRAYINGEFATAPELYAQAVRAARQKDALRVQRARTFVQLNRPDSAVAELARALEEVRGQDRKEMVYVYQSKAILEHTIGAVHLGTGRVDLAREAFARALQEDLSFAPAHVQLAAIALHQQDTLSAVSAMELALQARPDDAGLRYQAAFLLHAVGRYADAEQHAAKSIELNPYFALPRFLLAEAQDRQDKRAEALASYQAFLSRARSNDQWRAQAAERVKVLSAASGGGPA
jgi:tetratricopeptide (TPR) repeat protein